ncbi:SULFATE ADENYLYLTRANSFERASE SUBUNIT [Salix viminalis]|uniref:SULFATE ADENYLYLTRANSFERASE SUBUNIT n=2 Tax=Salix TaxID=40685 RepID=A0A6N2M425_SALVM|nr:Sulfate adenylyltransferase [Salix suchowensis]KAJ6332374.1 hypothetical protein OIU76_010707 [Salix suchowensis]KAJ6408559.1 hypothetical protein OIU84_011812 [Salix udensis]KAJ6741474.1 SULFATE ADENYLYLTRANSFERASE SUBUNIT [Salix viminalis]
MALVLSINPLHSSTRPESNCTLFYNQTLKQDGKQRWATLQQNLRCNGRFTCLFSSSGREEQAKKALESALGGKKDEFEKWNKEIKKREEAGGGGDTGGGGWFGWGGRFGWSNGDNFWPEAQQTSLAVLGIIAMYLVVAKGDLILAVIFNPLLYALRGTRNGLTLISSKILRNASVDSPSDFSNALKNGVYAEVSAKESVKRKWGSD